MERSKIVLERIKETWPSDLPLPRVLRRQRDFAMP